MARWVNTAKGKKSVDVSIFKLEAAPFGGAGDIKKRS
jgi:hypothetical protein